MFSGIVSAIGIIKQIYPKIDSIDFIIQTTDTCQAAIFNHLEIGESIAVNGVCLTVTYFENDIFHVTAVPETLRLTNLGQLTENSFVNLERSITPSTRLGGHYVQGHVDAVGEILDIQPDGKAAVLVKISIPKALGKYIVTKGYITLDGMSITVIDTTDDWFTVTFIPHTQENTIVKYYQQGSKINLEVDILSKYIEKLLGASPCNLISSG
ncbi:MAG: ribE [Gammaproteobacteria bacterium]|jgi:riboflavin synthase|nr:ribE [Gammaproteobacteria bacterium]